MAVVHINNLTPASGVNTSFISALTDFDYFVSVVCANKGMGDAKVTIYAASAGAAESAKMYFCKEQVISGNTTFETKKLTVPNSKALYIMSDNGNVAFSCVGLKTAV